MINARPALLLALAMILLVGTGCGPLSTAEDSGVRVLAPSVALELLETERHRQIIDVRTLQEFSEGHLDNAVLMDFYEDDFAAAIDDLDRDQPYVIYCRSGNRSGQTRQLMEDLGFTDVVDIDGGIESWLAEGLPTTR